MKQFKTSLLLLALLALTYCASANGGENGAADPTLLGFVSDAISKKPLKGVTILVTTCGSKIEKSYTTDDCGKFRIPMMGCNELTVVLEKKGYKTVRKEKIIMRDGMQLVLNFDILNEEKLDENIFHPLLRMMDN